MYYFLFALIIYEHANKYESNPRLPDNNVNDISRFYIKAKYNTIEQRFRLGIEHSKHGLLFYWL